MVLESMLSDELNKVYEGFKYQLTQQATNPNTHKFERKPLIWYNNNNKRIETTYRVN